jgi:signal transduction histidine kinase/DNA-binding response OmpR family regulator
VQSPSDSLLPVTRRFAGRILAFSQRDGLDGFLTELRRDHHVDRCDSAESVIRDLAGDSYDVLLLDLASLGADPARVLREVRSGAPETPVILLAPSDEAPRATMAGRAFDCLREPLRWPELSHAVERALERRRALRLRRRDQERWRRMDAAVRQMNMASDLENLTATLQAELPGLLDVNRFELYRFDNCWLRLACASDPPPERRNIFVGREPGPLRDAVVAATVVTVPPANAAEPFRWYVPVFVQDALVAVLLLERQLAGASAASEREQPFFQAVGAHVGNAILVRERAVALEKALRELRAAQGDLLRSERTAAVGKLAATISHELRNPLTSLTFTLENIRELCAKPALDGAAIHAQVVLLSDDVRRMRDRLQAFLSIARPAEGREIRCDVAAIARQVIARFRADPRARTVGFDEQYVAKAYVQVDEDQMFAAISNLVINALDAVAATAAGRVAIVVTRASDQVTLSVSDNGPGVPASLRDRIFDVFFTTKDSGSGLGLSQVASFAERSGGRVWLADNDHGACFVLALPEDEAVQDEA